MIRIHPLADVQSTLIGDGTQIWQFAVILPKTSIGKNCNINAHTFIENDVVLGDNVTIKCGVHLWDGIEIEDDVFIGPSVAFTNDIFPRSKQRITFKKTLLKKGCSIGANASIIGGVTIGEYAMVGMGSVITSDVKAYALVYGNPARQMGWIDEMGQKMQEIEHGIWESTNGQRYFETASGLNTLVLEPQEDQS
jgi:UDP-2-acetamido-3-amino-2,3-dideoxy-glucuronate N-acetyltransferase